MEQWNINFLIFHFRWEIMFNCWRNCEDHTKFINKLNSNNKEAMKDKMGSSLNLNMNHVVGSQECAHDDLRH